MIDQALEDLRAGIDRLKADLAAAQAEAAKNREELQKAVNAWWDLRAERNKLRAALEALMAEGLRHAGLPSDEEPEDPDYILLKAREHDADTATADAEAEADYLISQQKEL